MPGVRIQHRYERNVTVALEDRTQLLVGQQDGCWRCGGAVHVFKTYHLELDDTGSVIVSVEVAERLKRLGPFITGFEVMGEVLDPPAQFIGIGGPLVVASPVVKLDT